MYVLKNIFSDFEKLLWNFKYDYNLECFSKTLEIQSKNYQYFKIKISTKFEEIKKKFWL